MTGRMTGMVLQVVYVIPAKAGTQSLFIATDV